MVKNIFRSNQQSSASRNSWSQEKENRKYVGASNHECDYPVNHDGRRYAGLHLLVDLWGAKHLDDAKIIELALLEAARESAATVLNLHLHEFSKGGGISGILALAESHISIHTWPELGFAAVDIFMCGKCDSYDAIPALERAFSPSRILVEEQCRGLVL